MADWKVVNPQFAWLLLLAVGVLALASWAAWRRRQGWRRFAGPESINRVRPESSWRGTVSAMLLATAIGLLVLSALDIRWGKSEQEVPQRGLEVVFALDVSRSMLAEDVRPNRLTRAKQQIKDMIAQMAGDRIGLVAFAGEARQIVPMTNHYEDFKLALDAVSPDSVMTGGSRLAEAITAAAESFIDKTNNQRTVVLFTDGEDQESDPVAIAESLHRQDGIRMITVGLGDMDQGARIPGSAAARQPYIEYQGQPVWSKLNGAVLKSIADQTSGAYIPAGTKRVNMGDVYHRFVADVELVEFESAKISIYTPRFQWFAFPALLLLILEAWLGSAPGKTTPATVSMPTAVKPMLALALLLWLPGQSVAQPSSSPAVQVNQANQMLEQGNYEQAIELYRSVTPATAEQQDQLAYNLGVAQYRQGQLEAAAASFEAAARSQDSGLAAKARYNLGNANYSRALAAIKNSESVATEFLDAAVANYRSALRLENQLDDARANLELAFRLLNQLEKQQDQSQPNQSSEPDQNQARPDQSETEDQEADSEQDQSEASESSPQPEKESESSDNESQDESSRQDASTPDSAADQGKENQDSDPQSTPSEGQQDGDQQDSGGSDSDQPRDEAQHQGENAQQTSSQQSDPSAQPAANSKADSTPSDSADNPSATPTNDSAQAEKPPGQSQSAENAPDPKADSQPDRSGDSNSEPPPSGELTAANSNDQGSGEAQTPVGILSGEADDGLMTRQEALKLLQSVRDRDMLRRLRQQRQQRSRRVPVEKDW